VLCDTWNGCVERTFCRKLLQASPILLSSGNFHLSFHLPLTPSGNFFEVKTGELSQHIEYRRRSKGLDRTNKIEFWLGDSPLFV